MSVCPSLYVPCVCFPMFMHLYVCVPMAVCCVCHCVCVPISVCPHLCSSCLCYCNCGNFLWQPAFCVWHFQGRCWCGVMDFWPQVKLRDLEEYWDGISSPQGGAPSLREKQLHSGMSTFTQRSTFTSRRNIVTSRRNNFIQRGAPLPQGGIPLFRNSIFTQKKHLHSVRSIFTQEERFQGRP